MNTSFIIKEMKCSGGGVNEHGVDEDIGSGYARGEIGVKNCDAIGSGTIIFCIRVYADVYKTRGGMETEFDGWLHGGKSTRLGGVCGTKTLEKEWKILVQRSRCRFGTGPVRV